MRKKIYIISSLITFSAVSAYMVYAIFTSPNSTSVIAIPFIPIYGALATLVTTAFIYLFFVSRDLVYKKTSLKSKSGVLAIFLLAFFLLFGFGFCAKYYAIKIASNPDSSYEQQNSVYKRWLPWGKRDVLIALGENPNLDIRFIEEFSKGKDNHIVSLISKHPKVSLDILEMIASGSRDYDRSYGLAVNPKINQKIIDRLINVSEKNFLGKTEYELYQTYVLANLVRNPALPKKSFDVLANWRSPEYFLINAIINSPLATCKQIYKFIDHENHVLQNAVYNQYKKRKCE